MIEGNIIQMADRVMDVLKAKYLTSPIHYEDMKRREPLEIPEDALREILYNAIAHKDYSGAPIQMRVWDDYIEIWNEGELPTNLTPELLMKKHSSHPRNKNIANAFFKAGFIESWGRGYEKIRNGFEKAGLPMPTIEAVEGGVRVTFKRNNLGNASIGDNNVEKDVEKTVEKDVEKTVEKVWKLMKENPYITTKQIADVISISPRGVEENIKKLKQQGRLRREGADKGGVWVVIGDVEP